MTRPPVEPLIRSTLEAFAYPLAQQGFKVEVSVAPDLPDVTMDADAVGQALANLIDNAIKYSADERSLTVDARVADGRLVVAVSEPALRVAPQEHAKILEEFYRVGRHRAQRRGDDAGGLA